jgi:hypothetical protein
MAESVQSFLCDGTTIKRNLILFIWIDDKNKGHRDAGCYCFHSLGIATVIHVITGQVLAESVL